MRLKCSLYTIQQWLTTQCHLRWCAAFRSCLQAVPVALHNYQPGKFVHYFDSMWVLQGGDS